MRQLRSLQSTWSRTRAAVHHTERATLPIQQGCKSAPANEAQAETMAPNSRHVKTLELLASIARNLSDAIGVLRACKAWLLRSSGPSRSCKGPNQWLPASARQCSCDRKHLRLAIWLPCQSAPGLLSPGAHWLSRMICSPCLQVV